jgi:hypothetical protein
MITKIMGCTKSNSKRKVYSNKKLQEGRRTILNGVTVHFLELEKEHQTKPKVSRKEGNNED